MVAQYWYLSWLYLTWCLFHS